jgi:hypothetical protein
VGKNQVNARLSDYTRQQLQDLAARHGTQTEALAIAIDQLHRTEFAHKQEDNVDEKLAELAAAIYTEADGTDDTEYRARITQEIYEWLVAGDGGVGRTVVDLAWEWRDYQEDAEDALAQ